jgi:hypothetical protein
MQEEMLLMNLVVKGFLAATTYNSSSSNSDDDEKRVPREQCKKENLTHFMYTVGEREKKAFLCQI